MSRGCPTTLSREACACACACVRVRVCECSCVCACMCARACVTLSCGAYLRREKKHISSKVARQYLGPTTRVVLPRRHPDIALNRGQYLGPTTRVVATVRTQEVRTQEVRTQEANIPDIARVGSHDPCRPCESPSICTRYCLGAVLPSRPLPRGERLHCQV